MKQMALSLSGAACLLVATAYSRAQSTDRPAVDASFARYQTTHVTTEAVTTSQYVSMRDGVRLAVSITRPSKDGKPIEGKFPVIWQHALTISSPGILRNREGAGGYGTVPGLAMDGYVVAQVARRGQGQSFGKRRGYNDRSEAYDAYEMIDWLASQPWSTGIVGMYGCSNTGDAAMHAVTAANPHLKAVWAGCFSWDKYDGFWRGGIYANWGTGPERTLEQDLSNTPVQGDESRALLRQAAEEHQGSTVLTEMWAAMPFRDDYAPGVGSRFWYEGSVATYMPQIQQSGTAIYIQGGWRDDLRGQGLLTFANIKADKHLVVGPWGHCQSDGLDLVAEMRRFFDQHLKGINTGILEQDPIHYYTVNADAGKEWRTSKTWPLAGATATKFYMDGQGAAGGWLKAEGPTGAGTMTVFTVRYDVDAGNAPRGPGLLTGAPPRPVEHGGPRFVTAPLNTDTEVTGDAIVDLWMSSTAADGNIFVYLEDVAPDGRVTQVTDARLKASVRKLSKPRYENYGLPFHAALRGEAQPLSPGEPVEMVFAFLPTSYVFKARHSIRISVAGADYRERDRTPVAPAPVVTLRHTPQYPSFISLPIVSR
ncbi:MAG TPA: CocE/NonD family hydrolase [Terriglobia bacterium]|nr:CocE/NonD family hydrolase [Terriglobia bacterium]